MEELKKLDPDQLLKLLDKVPRLASLLAYASFGGINAQKNKTDLIIGILQGVAIEATMHSKWAGSLAGGAAVAISHGALIADMVIDPTEDGKASPAQVAFVDLLGSVLEKMRR